MTTTSEPVIREQTEEYAVIEKPSGLLVHEAGSAPEEESLADWIREKLPAAASVGDEPDVRPGIVHRLDREASGLMVVALTQPSFENIKTQFKDHLIEKEYLVLVYGRVLRDFGEINLPISRKRGEGRMAAHPVGTEDAHEAHTEYYVEKRFTTTTLLRVKISTGRSHQIRVHMAALQHPVVGDPLYLLKKAVGKAFPLPPRLFLHAAKLVFTDLAGTRHTFESELPPELAEYLTKFKPALV